jgi:hypothetical protein
VRGVDRHTPRDEIAIRFDSFESPARTFDLRLANVSLDIQRLSRQVFQIDGVMVYADEPTYPCPNESFSHGAADAAKSEYEHLRRLERLLSRNRVESGLQKVSGLPIEAGRHVVQPISCGFVDEQAKAEQLLQSVIDNAFVHARFRTGTPVSEAISYRSAIRSADYQLIKRWWRQEIKVA